MQKKVSAHAGLANNKNDDGILQRKLKAYEFASDVIKQYSNLSVLLLGATVVFINKITNNSPCMYKKTLIVFAVILYLLSLFFGLLASKIFTTEIEPDYERDLSIRKSQASKFVLIQIICFYLAFFITLFLGWNLDFLTNQK
ncbi:TPA: hypothetical protein ACGAEL_001544 [Legionella pneumophila]|uniref:hypothetical protein n=1 Tax=Legionella pneumophila TaxID=446 RepID=UPI0007787DA7|nr:hypothetical protein [Legionella pneumophila]HCC3234926.1 hypothetical protein [Legionella pneumophila subsp. pneumophila]HAT8621981.1 hypothetical protein [Legionella pneumophila]HAU9853234.1 hypothetical protein [Legionella pneumophila]HAU9908231.1 hypothetical protein [Legionella pneumophila]HAV0029409.1 hypothetical protein [Legionella pneumophila]